MIEKYTFELPIGGCISELNCLQVRSSANTVAVRDAQQHLRDYGALLRKHASLIEQRDRLRHIVEWALATLGEGDEPSWADDARAALAAQVPHE